MSLHLTDLGQASRLPIKPTEPTGAPLPLKGLQLRSILDQGEQEGTHPMASGDKRAEKSNDAGGDPMTTTAPPYQATQGHGESEDYQEAFVAIHEVAARLHVSESTVRSWFDHGVIRGHRLPTGARRIPRSEVERLAREMFAVPRNMGPTPTPVRPPKPAPEQPEPAETYPNF